MGRLSLPLISGLDTGLVVPAVQLTGLMRALADEWERWTEDADAGLDPGTVLALAGVLRQLSDQIDVECIAAASGD
ncbi:DUF6213 family protein [Kitasatospora terrestris]|uniref:Uncharacterized protein n=1 Tax=Kitasatospora terrestris TaxID=258051 RepID=A0ABP9EPM7_9ACTN